MTRNEKIEAIEGEFQQIEASNAWNALYVKIRSEGTYENLSCSVARSSASRSLNRYRDVLPYDHSRIILKDHDIDYINASLVKQTNIGREYILCQGPLSQTTPHFWLMVWQQKTKGIVMLNKIVEKNQIKCHQYWPLGVDKHGENISNFPSVNLKVELLKEVNHSHYIYRTFRLTNTKEDQSREILHFHYTTWPDFGVPQSPEAFFTFLGIVRASQCLEPKHGPAVIHCSAGIGRSGTFCLVDSVLKQLSDDVCSGENGQILEVLLKMRKERMGLIQTPDQLRFSYQAIVHGARRLDQTNGKDPTEESSSEEISQEEPPPCPPPRSASLGGRISVDSDKDDDEATDTDEIEDEERLPSSVYQRDFSDLNDDAFERPLPDVPSSESSAASTPAVDHLNDSRSEDETEQPASKKPRLK